ncbi:putative glycosyl hydrolase-like family 6 (GHL6) protein [Kribbella sp. VKM Ac-2571]|uniref:alpha-amylase family protein n=1 Tax=Kribbella sp. VKM Ac-2571 TaxID=2512222 RepID=UPI0010DD24A6|nr:alpha-amylase family protein [Kribbella sp. VKM Ac-2571]TDO55103.1 putative glycosyl hydrolase-like family 6 (GHL6) protein [Kribbella sp. VKM Ac-2571]
MRLWWQDPFRMFQTNLREIDAGLDVESVLDYLEEFGADTWLLSVGGILSNYPTDLEFQTRNPHLAGRPSGDLVGDAVKAAARRGIRVMGRMDFSKIDHRRAEAHPAWCFVGPSGARQVYNGLTSVCPSGDYYQVKLFEVLDEVLDRYPLDGFFCNWMSFNEVDYSRVYHGVCHCVACQERYDGVLPDDRDSPGYADWQRFSKEVLADLTGRIREHLAARRPEAPLVLGDQADIVFHEANNAVGRRLWHHRTSESVSAAKTFRPTVPVLTNSVGFVDMPYRMASEDPHHFAQYLVQAIARGANPSTYIMGTPATTPYACLDVAAQLTRFHRDHAEVYRDLVPAAQTLLVRPVHSRAEFEGLYLSLLQRHVPFDVLPEERLGEADLTRYRTVVLPNVGPVDLGTYVGRVVATGTTTALPVRTLARYETEAETRSLHLEGGVPVFGTFKVIEAPSDAEVALRALSRAPYGPPEKCYGHVPLDHPGMVKQGNVVLFPWTIGQAYREVGLSVHRDLFVDQVGGAVETDLPEQVEIVLGRSAAGFVVHLLNRSGDADQRFAPPVRIGSAQLRVPADVREARALVAQERLPVSDGWVQVPEIGLFDVLVCV